MADEHDIARGVMQIASTQPSGICTFKRAYAEIPNYVHLDANNRSPSATRPGEEMWQQLVRNIKCHDGAIGNFITDGLLVHVPRVGYQITSLGRSRLSIV